MTFLLLVANQCLNMMYTEDLGKMNISNIFQMGKSSKWVCWPHVLAFNTSGWYKIQFSQLTKLGTIHFDIIYIEFLLQIHVAMLGDYVNEQTSRISPYVFHTLHSIEHPVACLEYLLLFALLWELVKWCFQLAPLASIGMRNCKWHCRRIDLGTLDLGHVTVAGGPVEVSCSQWLM